MKLLSHAIAYAKKTGFKNAFQKGLKRMIGIERQDEQINTLYYFLNHFVDITQLPPTKDEGLRNLQKGDALLLGVFDKICRKYDINYWIDFGTLLGQVRHKGFIPWDDDMDVSMTREDYSRFVRLTKSDFQLCGMEIVEYPGWIGIGYKHRDTGLWLDVFSRDKYSIEGDYNDEVDALKKKLSLYKKKYGIPKVVIEPNVLAERRRKTIGEGKGSNCIHYLSMEFDLPRLICHDEKWIFPLQRGLFEGIEVNIPNNADASLRQTYGPHYMEFPKGGVEKHDLGRGLLSTWASKSGTDMKEVIDSLRSIYNTL